MAITKEEDVAVKREELFKEIERMPKEFAKFEAEVGDDIVKVEVHPAMKLYLNGREER